jgi:hypothetical protein
MPLEYLNSKHYVLNFKYKMIKKLRHWGFAQNFGFRIQDLMQFGLILGSPPFTA